MFFSGAAFPLPEVTIFHIFGHSAGPFDLLSATHAVIALNKVCALGVGFGDVLYEIVMLIILSVLYFIIGVVLFRKMHLRGD